MKDKVKKEKSAKKPAAEPSCCSFSNTEDFLKRALGESGSESPKQECSTSTSEEIKDFVKNRYASLVSGPSSCGCGCGGHAEPNAFNLSTTDRQKWVEQLGYTEVELKDLPKDVTEISFGCGNPTAIAELKPGEQVLDLGSGGGIDVFLAAKKVGSRGKAIGLDMTPVMIEKANANAQKMGLPNVEFKLGEIEQIPLANNSIDVIISNCVINLAPDKAKVFREVFRVLKPGGRIAVSDIVLNGELPTFIKNDFEAWAGCVAGALQEEDYLQKIRDAGFTKVVVEAKRTAKELSYAIKESPQVIQKLKAETGCTPEEILNRIVSIKVKAYKPK